MRFLSILKQTICGCMIFEYCFRAYNHGYIKWTPVEPAPVVILNIPESSTLRAAENSSVRS